MKQKRVKRRDARICVMLFVNFVLVSVMGFATHRFELILGGLVMYGASVYMQTQVNRCPHCGTYFRGYYWSKSAGYCQNCGQHILFDDEPEENDPVHHGK